MKEKLFRRGIGMLLQFRFKNYKSFAEDAILDMTATTIKEHDNSLIIVNENKILPVAAIFGANASGKSNIFGAFYAMCADIVNTFDDDEKHSLIRPFSFCNEQKNMPTEFEVSINIDDKEFRYGYIRDQNIVYEEWLFEKKFAKNSRTKERCIYYRENSKVDLDLRNKEEFEEISFVNSMISDSNLLLTTLGKRSKSIYSKVYNWFKHTTQLQDFSNDYDEFANTEIAAEFLYDAPDALEDVVKLLQVFDNAIVDLRIEKEMDKNLDEDYKVYSYHKCDGEELLKIPFQNESSGTQKIFSLATILMISISVGIVLFVDELDAKLHPLALRYLIRLFTNKKNNVGNGQLIFSSHNLVCLDSSDLRRDEIWFVEKNNQMSSLYSLYDFKEDSNSVRSDLSFGKNYLSGRFGAIPFQE